MATAKSNERQRRPGSPTAAPPEPPGLNSVLSRNIQALLERRRQEAADARWQDRVSDAITRFTGSMTFVVLHAAIFGGWIVVNLGLLPLIPAFDPTFVVVGLGGGVEAIFLSTFVLISQNRMAAAADKRADLDLQISLLAEHEITRAIAMLDAISKQLGVAAASQSEIDELKEDVAATAVLEKIEKTTEQIGS